MSIVKAFASWI